LRELLAFNRASCSWITCRRFTRSRYASWLVAGLVRRALELYSFHITRSRYASCPVVGLIQSQWTSWAVGCNTLMPVVGDGRYQRVLFRWFYDPAVFTCSCVRWSHAG